MSKQTTIQNQLANLQVAISDDLCDDAAALVRALAKRKLSDQQRTEFEELEALFQEMDKPARNMSSQLAKYRPGYKPTIAGSGAKSLSNGDDLAQFLEHKTPEQVCKLADEACGEPDGFHAAKYERLNPGQRRMNAGNKIRARWKKGEWSIPA